MGIFGTVFGTKVKDPVLDEIRKEEKVIFGLNKEELAYGVNTIKQLTEAEVIIESAIKNTDDLLHRVISKKPFPHDFDWEDVAGEYKDASRVLNLARHSSFTFSITSSTVFQSKFNLEVLSPILYAENKAGKIRSPLPILYFLEEFLSLIFCQFKATSSADMFSGFLEKI